MTTGKMNIKRLLPNDHFLYEGDTFEVGVCVLVVAPNKTFTTNQLGEWIEEQPLATPRYELTNLSQRWDGYFYPATGDWIRTKGDLIEQHGTFPSDVELTEVDFEALAPKGMLN